MQYLRSVVTVLMIFFLVWTGRAVAMPFAMDSGFQPSLEILEDSAHSLNADSILDVPPQRWQRVDHGTPSYGFSGSVYWVRFSVSNDEERSQRLYVEVGYPLLNDVALYQMRDGRLMLPQKLGNSFPFHDRVVQHRNLLFPVVLRALHTDTFYMRIESNSALQFPVTVWGKQAFHAQDQLSIFQQGAYYGLVFVMVLYNLFLYWQIRDRVYLYYVMYVSTFSLAQMALNGFAYQMLWPDSPHWNQISIAVVTPAIVTFGCIFVCQALQLKKNAPLFRGLMMIMAVTGAVLFLASMVFAYHVMIKLVATLVIVSCSTALAISYLLWLRRKMRFAAYFSMAWTVFLFGVVCLAMSKFGLIPRNLLTESSAQVGSAIEIILLSYALAERLREAMASRLDAERESRLANEKILHIQQELTANLEKQFNIKTRELHDALEEVKILNAELTEISHTDQLTGARNRRFMDAFMVREIKRANRYHRPLSLIMMDIDHFKQVNDRYGHPVGDMCLQRVVQAITAELRRCHDEVCRYGGEEIAVVLPDTTLEGAAQRAQRIREAIEALVMDTGEEQFHVTISMGVSSTETPKIRDILSLTTAADQALYQAKRSGRNCVRVHGQRNNVHWLNKNTD